MFLWLVSEIQLVSKFTKGQPCPTSSGVWRKELGEGGRVEGGGERRRRARGLGKEGRRREGNSDDFACVRYDTLTVDLQKKTSPVNFLY